MKHLIKRVGEIRLTPCRFFGFWIALFAVVFLMASCSEDLDVQQAYPFDVEVMPFSEKIVKGQTVELRFEIKPEGDYSNTLYTIRYFQYDGDGMLKLVGGPVLVNNDRVLMESRSFRLNYTARSAGAHKFLVVIEDNFGSTPWEKTFEFNDNDASGDGDDDDDPGTGLIGPIVGPVLPPIQY